MTFPTLKKFEIKGLHGDRNITLNFKEGITILVDGNGAGKTTVLNSLFYILDNKPWKLAKYDFSKVKLTFSNDEILEYEKETLIADPAASLFRGELFGNFSLRTQDVLKQNMSNLMELSSLVAARDPSVIRTHPLFRHIDAQTDISTATLVDIVRYLRQTKGSSPSLTASSPHNELQHKLSAIFPHHVLYFPTYRRIEEDLNSIGIRIRNRDDDSYHSNSSKEGSDEELIQFGMNDVKQRIESITKKMQDSSMEWFSIVSGQIITQLTDGIAVSDEMRQRISDVAMLKIVLERIGSNIKPAKKNDILRIISTGEMRDEKYEPLVYFLFNLSQIYEKQKDQDDSIKTFARVCNSYLNDSDKEFRYDESKLQLPILQKRSNRSVQLDRLSSGEKQVVSIFSRLYLMSQQTYAILFDEPELSLSMEWQRKLLCDIAQSGRCPLIVAATHSPFIFENELDYYTTQLEVEYIASEGT